MTVEAVDCTRGEQKSEVGKAIGGNAVVAFDIVENGCNLGILCGACVDARGVGILLGQAIGHFVGFFEHRHIEALGVVFPWGDAARFGEAFVKGAIAVLGQAWTEADARNIGNVEDSERVARDERLYDGLIFVGIEGARRINDASSDAQQTATGQKNAVLELILGRGIFARGPTRPVFVKGVVVSEAGTRDVGEYAIEHRGEEMGQAFGGHVVEDGVGDEHGVKARRKRRHAFSGEVVGIETPFVAHGRGNLCRFGPWSRAQVHDRVSGTGIEKPDGKLGAEALLDEPSGKMVQTSRWFVRHGTQSERIIESGDGFDIKPFFFEHAHDVFS